MALHPRLSEVGRFLEGARAELLAAAMVAHGPQPIHDGVVTHFDGQLPPWRMRSPRSTAGLQYVSILLRTVARAHWRAHRPIDVHASHPGRAGRDLGVELDAVLVPPVATRLFSPYIVIASAIGEIPLEFWLIIMAVNAQQWRDQEARAYAMS